MQFYEYKTFYEIARYSPVRERSANVYDFYKHVLKGIEKDYSTDSLAIKIPGMLEMIWYAMKRPYYKVWPGVTDALLRVNLKCLLQDLRLPMPDALLVRFAVGQEPVVAQSKIKTVLVGRLESKDVRSGLVCGCEIVNLQGTPSERFMVVPQSDKTIEEQFTSHSYFAGDESVDQGVDVEMKIRGAVARIAISVLLMRGDPTFVKPDVLAADRTAYYWAKEPEKERLVEKAKAKGIVGFNIGEDYEAIPHIRRPHLGLRWTGKGKEVPKIVPIKGSLVHRDKLTKVPTGHLTPEGQEVEV